MIKDANNPTIQEQFDTMAMHFGYRMTGLQLEHFARKIGQKVEFNLIDMDIQDALYNHFGYFINHTHDDIFTVEPTKKTNRRLMGW